MDPVNTFRLYNSLYNLYKIYSAGQARREQEEAYDQEVADMVDQINNKDPSKKPASLTPAEKSYLDALQAGDLTNSPALMADLESRLPNPVNAMPVVSANAGSNPELAEAAKALEEAKQKPTEASAETTESETSSLPKKRPFTDQTFMLMHLYNLINLRNEKMTEDNQEVIDEDSSENGVISNTVKSLKSPNPYAYIPTAAHPLEQNAVIQCYGEPAPFINYLKGDPNIQSYLDLTTQELSELTTKIRLYKVFHRGTKERAVEIKFETAGIGASELNNVLSSNGTKRGYGSGIKSFNITYDGVNPVTATKTLAATLTIHANSMEELLRPRRGPAVFENDDSTEAAFMGYEYRYFDLAVKSVETMGSNRTLRRGPFGSLEDIGFYIVADIGLVKGNALNGIASDATSVAVKLRPHTHVFNLEQDGSVELMIEYKGEIESRFSDPVRFDIFSTKTSMTFDMFSAMGVAMAKQTCSPEQITALRKKMTALSNTDYKTRITQINDLLRHNQKLYYIRLPPKVLQAYSEAFNAYEKSAEEINSAADQTSETMKKRIEAAFDTLRSALGSVVPPATEENSNSLSITAADFVSKESEEIKKEMENKEKNDEGSIRDCAIDPNATQVAYFYVGDLINLILKNLSALYSSESVSEIVNNAGKLIDGQLSEKSANASQLDELFDELGGTSGNLLAINEQVVKLGNAARDFKKYRIVLGPTMISDYFSTSEIMCSIGDIPVPLVHFNAWLSEQMDGSDRKRYPLHQFLNDFINKYLRSYLMGEKEFLDAERLGQLKVFGHTPMTGYASPNPEVSTDPLTIFRTNPKYGGRKGLVHENIPYQDRPIIRTKYNKLLSKNLMYAHDYHVFYDRNAGFILPKNTATLANYGIGIYQHGKDRGILKDIQYQRTEIRGRKETYFYGSQDGMAQLAEVFDATLTTFPDLHTFNGDIIYIDPKSINTYLSQESLRSFDSFTIEDLGLGGYYLVTHVTHHFEQGKFETKLKTTWQWNNNSTKEESKLFQEESDSSPDEAPKEASNPCKTNLAPEPGAAAGSDTFNKAFETAESVFGTAKDKVVGFIKGIFDATDNEPSIEEIALTFDQDRKLRAAGINPDKAPSASAGHNGPS